MRCIPFTPPTEIIDGNTYEVLQLEHHILRQRRMEMGLSMKDVAEMAKITIKQYQRFESGERTFSSSSARMFMAICTVLRLDPYLFLPLMFLVKNPKDYEEVDMNNYSVETGRVKYSGYVSFAEFKSLMSKIPSGKLITSAMVEEYFKRKKGVEIVEIRKYNSEDYINRTYPFWREVSNTGILFATTRFYSRDVQREKLEEEGFEIVACGANGSSLRVKNYKEYLVDLETIE